jgi:hypothetical protein
MHGRGVHIWPDGSRCEVRYHRGRILGGQVFIGRNGERYEGEWLDNQKHGRGKLTWPDGSSYEGQFAEDKMHG